MTLFKIGLALLAFLALPPVANFLESHMVLHMHMQMPLLVIAGMLMEPVIRKRLPRFFEQYNQNGVPGILLLAVVELYWSIPRAMDEALTVQMVEIFKFVSLPFLAGVPLRNSWGKLSRFAQNMVVLFFAVLYFGMGWLYLYANEQLCNSYLLIEQITLGWAFLLTAGGMTLYLVYAIMVKPEQYEP